MVGTKCCSSCIGIRLLSMHLALLPRAAGAISSPWRMALTLAVSLGAMRMVQTVVEGLG